MAVAPLGDGVNSARSEAKPIASAMTSRPRGPSSGKPLRANHCRAVCSIRLPGTYRSASAESSASRPRMPLTCMPSPRAVVAAASRFGPAPMPRVPCSDGSAVAARNARRTIGTAPVRRACSSRRGFSDAARGAPRRQRMGQRAPPHFSCATAGLPTGLPRRGKHC